MAGSAGLAAVALVVHILAAIVWVGGMFFAHQVLRPAAAMLEPGPRLILWSRVLGRFFAWVIAAIILLLLSGYTLVFGVFGGFRAIGLYIHLMQGLGILMSCCFCTFISRLGAGSGWRWRGRTGPRAVASSGKSEPS